MHICHSFSTSVCEVEREALKAQRPLYALSQCMKTSIQVKPCLADERQKCWSWQGKSPVLIAHC